MSNKVGRYRAGRALPYNTMKAEAQDRDGRKAMGEEKERNERRSGKGWEKRWKEIREDTEKDERRSGKGWEKRWKEMREDTEKDERRSGKRWEKEAGPMPQLSALQPDFRCSALHP